jgi:hypothetical protein
MVRLADAPYNPLNPHSRSSLEKQIAHLSKSEHDKLQLV